MIPILMERTKNVNLTSIALKFLAAMRPRQSPLFRRVLDLYVRSFLRSFSSKTCSFRYKISPNCPPSSSSSDCFCSQFYNYSRLISDVLFNHDYFRFLLHRLRLNKRTFVYRYSHRTSIVHPSSCHSYLHKVKAFVGHFAELEYLWGIPLLLQSNVTRIRTIEYRTTFDEEKRRFSEEFISRWAKFIRHGQAWKSINDGAILNIRANQSVVEPFHLPATVHFWLTSASVSFSSTLTIVILLITVAVIQ